ncbi:MAG: hypothetical protein HLUCCA08_01590 [Rhodobacteraceae bacterium HLUCCA08]|nr:MAG: hypothetical protein HLUCCA08_01590 [Rhodobacteraceae bacterium HLUCCA08]
MRMGQTWIVDVLKDLETFARDNDMPLLERQLGLCAQVAHSEVTTRSQGGPETAEIYGLDGRRVSAQPGKRNSA